MKPKNPLTTVTFFSKTLAFILFIAFPFASFYLGVSYQKSVTIGQTVSQTKVVESGIQGNILVFHCNGRLALASSLCWQTVYPGFALIQNQATGETKKVQADDNGVFTISLSPGTYIVSPVDDNKNLLAGSKRLVQVKKGQVSPVLIQYTVQ